MVRDLVELLQEAKQEIPKWLEAIASETRWGGGGRRGGTSKRFSGGFGSRDYRTQDRKNGSSHQSDNRQGFNTYGGVYHFFCDTNLYFKSIVLHFILNF